MWDGCKYTKTCSTERSYAEGEVCKLFSKECITNQTHITLPLHVVSTTQIYLYMIIHGCFTYAPSLVWAHCTDARKSVSRFYFGVGTQLRDQAEDHGNLRLRVSRRMLPISWRKQMRIWKTSKCWPGVVNIGGR
jgi:hypothetical protein